MGRNISIRQKMIGHESPCCIVAEIGINHNGDIEIAKKLIDAAVLSGCDAVKFQKRTVDTVYSKEELDRPRESPFGSTNRDLKCGLELSRENYQIIDQYCRERQMIWFASCWDEDSVDFIEKFDPPCYKIASAMLTNDRLLRYHRTINKPLILSTGMSTWDEIKHAVDILQTENLILMHCTSTYPSRPEELNLRVIGEMMKLFNCPIGYSGHEVGLQTTLAAVVAGACVVERHITLDRSMWGSDQAASVEPQGFFRLVRDIRVIEMAMGDGIKKVYPSELPIKEKLRRS